MDRQRPFLVWKWLSNDTHTAVAACAVPYPPPDSPFFCCIFLLIFFLYPVPETERQTEREKKKTGWCLAFTYALFL